MHVPEMFSDHRMFMFLYPLMEMAASVPNIICIAQFTFEFVYYTLLDDQGKLFFCDSQMISDLMLHVNTGCSCRLIFVAEITKSSANHVSQFLIFKWQRKSIRTETLYLSECFHAFTLIYFFSLSNL